LPARWLPAPAGRRNTRRDEQLALSRWSRRCATVALLVVSLAAVASPASASEHARPFSGFGATLAAWAKAYPPDAAQCPASTCYGPVVASLPATPEFSFVTTSKGRVVGYDQALRRGTPLLQAELEVAEMFPADATQSPVTVVRRDQFGSSCAVYDIQSKELTRLFGKHGFGDDGDNVGVELATLTRSGATTYNPRAIDLAIIIPSYADKSINC
jgi:hypothetical protein